MDSVSATMRKTGTARLLQLAATKKLLIIGAVFLSALAALVSFIPYLAMYRVIQEILGVLPDMDRLDAPLLIFYGWLAFGGVVGNIVLYFGALVCSHLAAFGTLYTLKIDFAAHLARVPLGVHVLVGSGKLRKIMDENIEKIEEFIAHQLPDLTAAFVAPVAMCILLFSIDWRFGLAAMFGVILSFVVQFSLYGNKKSKQMMNSYQKALEEMNNATVEYIRGMSVVKAFKQTVYSFRRLHDTIQAYTAMVIPYTLSWENSFSGFTTLVNNLYLFVVPVGIVVLARSTDYAQAAGSFVFYLLFMPSVASILMKVMYVNGNMMRILGGVESMDKILAIPELGEPSTPKVPASYDIVFDSVSFSYTNDAEAEALKHVSFTAKQGQITAIIGPSGGGKSTIAHLIPRFFDVTQGSITIGGVDVRDIDAESRMNAVSFVFQDVFLFKQSVLENIRMGNRNASTQEVIAAAKAAQCHEFIMKLPQGYDTVIGTKGVHLSGGERQRLAIARAIVRNAPIVVLDEATAFSDSENEHLIQKAFETLMQGKTVILIAHRLSTVKGANTIIVMEEGHVVEQGNHETLLQQKGKYAAMWHTYLETSRWSMTGAKGGTNHA